MYFLFILSVLNDWGWGYYGANQGCTFSLVVVTDGPESSGGGVRWAKSVL